MLYQSMEHYSPVVYAISKALASMPGEDRGAGDIAERMFQGAYFAFKHDYTESESVAYGILCEVLDSVGVHAPFDVFKASDELRSARVELVKQGAFHKYICSDLGCAILERSSMTEDENYELDGAATIERVDASSLGFSSYRITAKSGRQFGYDCEYDDFYNLAQED